VKGEWRNENRDRRQEKKVRRREKCKGRKVNGGRGTADYEVTCETNDLKVYNDLAKDVRRSSKG